MNFCAAIQYLSNRNDIASVPAKLYLQCVQEHKGCPLLVRSDHGTENGIIAGMQCFFRSDNVPFTGMEFPPEIRGLKTGGFISESQWEVGGSTFLRIWLTRE